MERLLGGGGETISLKMKEKGGSPWGKPVFASFEASKDGDDEILGNRRK